MSGILSASVESYDHTQDDIILDHYHHVLITSETGWTPEGDILKLSKMYMIKKYQLPHASPEVSTVMWFRTPFYWHDTASLGIWFQKFGGKILP
jgi:hypothetical protein